MNHSIPSVSVITAAFNADKYIERCIRSVLVQSIKTLEFIIVDDGSTDHTLEIVQNFSHRDSRIRYIHTANNGVASAKQTGLDLATGEYILFLDSDDFIDSEMLFEMYSLAELESADMVTCDYAVIPVSGQPYIKRQQPRSLDSQTILGQTFHELQGSFGNRIIRRACFEQYNIRFNHNLRVCEDQLVILQLLTHDIKISYIPKPFYHYDHTMNPSSLVNGGITVDERLLPIELLTKEFDISPVQKYFDNYVMFLAYEALYLPKSYCPRYRSTFKKYKASIRRSQFPRNNKYLVLLRINGILLPLSKLRRLYRFFVSTN